MTKYKLIIFDFDGTLADSFAVFVNAWSVVALRYGLKSLGAEEVERLRSYSAREAIAYLGVPRWKLPLLTREMRKSMQNGLGGVVLFSGVENLLRELKAKGLKIAVVTTNFRQNVERVLGPECICLIDCFRCGVSVFGKGPKIRSVIRAIGVRKKEVLCVGDEVRDAEVARELGIDFVGVSWGYTRAEKLRPFSKMQLCSSPEDILSLISVPHCR